MENATQALHRLTSYQAGRAWTVPQDDPRVLRDLQVNDMSRLPWPCKRYAGGLPRVPLPADLPATTPSLLSVLAGTAEVPPARLDLPHLSRLLYWSAGVVRTSRTPGREVLFRAAGSAGNRFPLELYVAVPDGGELPPGVHWYDPVGHALVQVGPAPRGGAPAVIVTGVPWRTGWRYAERGYRHIYWDAGTMLAQLLALAASAGLPAGLRTGFPDEAVAALTGADGTDEFPVAVVGLGDVPALTAAGPAVSGQVDAAPVRFPLVTAAQRAGYSGRSRDSWDPGPPCPLTLPASPPVETVIASRGSQRRFDPARDVRQELLRIAMTVSLRGIDVPHWLAVHAVTGLAPGIYRWPRLTAPVRPWPAGDAGPLRDELRRVCLGQSLARDAAFVVIAATDVGGLGDREYREAQLAAGLAEGRLHLAAYALGASATGMTFLDSEIPGLLGERSDGLLFTCVGVPSYKSARAGLPGSPAPVRVVRPRS